MTRPLRIQFPGAIYHVTSRGTRRGPIYHDARDYHIWQDLLGETAERYNFGVHAFCQMPNHFHMLVETADGNLSHGMRHLNSQYAQRFNYRYRSCGPVLQGRYHSVLIEHQSQLLEVARYVVLNPVRARLVRSEDEWKWSSHHYLIGSHPAPAWLMSGWLLAQFGHTMPKARAAYARFVTQGHGRPNPLSTARADLVLGRTPDEFGLQPSDLHLQGTSKRARRTLAHSLYEYAAMYPDRNEAMARAYISTAYSMREIGDFFGLSEKTVSRAVREWEVRTGSKAEPVSKCRI
jgi:REP element-mobilizing transposase RayT